MSRFMRPATAGVLFALVMSASVVAKSPHEVDPATVTPPLNPSFTWDCWAAGSGITCQGEFENGPYVGELGPTCGNIQTYLSGVGHERMTRWHDAEGRATRTRVHLSYPGDRFTLAADGSGPGVTVSGDWNRHYTYGVPGDRDSRVLTERGVIYLVRGVDGKILLRDVGQVEFAPGADFETIVRSPGQHDLYDDWFAAFEATICDELT